ncbi:hypothetical protein BJX61DRAFT_531654 [Aspergillus egyptiacus]|nr:hypothetical protein BJX61DRAFT_531654 [Aspergillus egyptiacus]
MTFPRRPWRSWGLLASCLPLASAAGRTDGYTHGQLMPVTCLNRTMYITDDLGKLQFIPFPTCKETASPLSFRYGVSESIDCTIASLPDELYHLFEYYVHSDVPMTCRVPTAPLSPSTMSSRSKEADKDFEEGNTLAVLDDDGPPYTPITFALQGTLQKSHLHIWTDMNVIAHNIPQLPDAKSKRKGQGYLVAGTAYSVPEFEYSLLGNNKDGQSDAEKEASAVSEAAREPWTAGHGTKVIRGEDLTFTFHISWIEGARGIGWPSRETSSSSAVGWFFGKMVFFVLAASVGALLALYWERNIGGRRRGWKGDGILGVPALGKGTVGVSFGNGGKPNGYGGYSAGAGVSPPLRLQCPQLLAPLHMILLRSRLLRSLPPQHGTQLHIDLRGLCHSRPAGVRAAGSPSVLQKAMSSLTIANLPRMTRDTLAALLSSTSSPSKLAIIDVRDSDHVGGHIFSSTWVPSGTLDHRLPELVRTLQDKEKVVFHCALSQQRGPSAALRYARERERMLGAEESHKQAVYVLEGGFVQWQEKYGKDVKLTEAYAEDIWREY